MKELTDEQLNEEICKYRGWIRCGDYSSDNLTCDLKGYYEGNLLPLPNHILGPEALSNMHNAISSLPEDKWCAFNGALMEQFKDERYGIHKALNATARQRAIALLHVVKSEIFL